MALSFTSLRNPIMSSIIIVGAGHAGVQAAAALRAEGYDGRLTLISEDTHLPYQRPPLSKAFLKSANAAPTPLRPKSFFVEKDVELLLGEQAVWLDRPERKVTLKSGAVLPYGHLILATGTKDRSVNIPGSGLHGILRLRNLAEAHAIRNLLTDMRQLVVVGAGFIGLEVAATASELGISVTVVEMNDRPLARSVSAGTASFFNAVHATFGIRLQFGVKVVAFVGTENGALGGIQLSNGEFVRTAAALIGAGVEPADELARVAGLVCRNGVLVDAALLTSDPHISAIGDVAIMQDAAGEVTSMQSVQNATDQANFVARRITGKTSAAYSAVPWFWSDQRNIKLQIVGLHKGCTEWVEAVSEASRMAFGFRSGRLAVIETINRPKDHLLARKLMGGGREVNIGSIADGAGDLNKLSDQLSRLSASS